MGLARGNLRRSAIKKIAIGGLILLGGIWGGRSGGRITLPEKSMDSIHGFYNGTGIECVAIGGAGVPPERIGAQLLREAKRCWEARSEFREQRQRNKRYTYGRQWNDLVTVNGQRMTEEEYITGEGHIPLKNNLIRRMVRNVLGTYINSREELLWEASSPDEEPETENINRRLREAREENSHTELTMRTMEEFLISGFIVWRKWYGERNHRVTVRTDYLSPDNFFMDTACCDFRGSDVEFLGEIHDIPFGRLCSNLARNDADYKTLAAIYTPELTAPVATSESFSTTISSFPQDFLRPSQPGLCRVIEIWRRERRPRYRCHDTREGRIFRIEASDYAERVERENARRLEEGAARGLSSDSVPLIKARWLMDECWRYYFLSPFGHILSEGETPYSHGGHPYIFKAYPFLDGEIHSFVADVIDQQRHINRLITIYDWVMRASAKGVLLFPESCMPDGWNLQDVADEWSKFNGVMMIKTKEGVPLPQQVSNNAVNIGVVELLNIQMQLFEDISGVNGALQGKLTNGNVSGALYSYQTRNALTSLLDILESFKTFEKEAMRMDVALLRQYALPHVGK